MRVNLVQEVVTPIVLYTCIFGVNIIVKLGYAFLSFSCVFLNIILSVIFFC
jgi:hypothetical protein